MRRAHVRSTRPTARSRKRLAGFDTPQNLVLSWGYELPFGKGKRFLSSAGRAANLIAGGWQVNAIQRYVSGTPIGVGGGGVIPLSNGGNRPNVVLGGSPRTNVSRGDFDPARDRYLDISAFSQPAPFTIGNAPPVLRERAHVRALQRRLQRAQGFQDSRDSSDPVPGGVLRYLQSSGLRRAREPTSMRRRRSARSAAQANSPRNIQLALKYVF